MLSKKVIVSRRTRGAMATGHESCKLALQRLGHAVPEALVFYAGGGPSGRVRAVRRPSKR